MSGFDPDAIRKILGETVQKLEGVPNILGALGISNVVRVSPKVWDEMQAQIAAGQATQFPFGIEVECDPDLQGDKFELGPKR